MPTSRATDKFSYIVGGKELVKRIRPLWEGLRDHHADLSERFGPEMRQFTFEDRHNSLLKRLKPKGLRIELVIDTDTDEPIGYSLSSVEKYGKGELNTLFVKEGYRSTGLGDELTERAVKWLDEMHADPVEIIVMFGNERVLSLYGRHGFEPRKMVLTRPKDIQ